MSEPSSDVAFTCELLAAYPAARSCRRVRRVTAVTGAVAHTFCASSLVSAVLVIVAIALTLPRPPAGRRV